jgi:hypothetical protein
MGPPLSPRQASRPEKYKNDIKPAHFTHGFFAKVTRKSCQNDVRTKNSYIKTLMKLTPEKILK